MGVKNLIKFIERYAPSSVRSTRITDYRNKTIGIDANLLLYKLILAIRQNGYDITNLTNNYDDDDDANTDILTRTPPEEIMVTHIHSLILKLIAFKQHNIIPVFVFDSGAPVIKADTLEDRKKARDAIIKKYKNSKTDKGKRIYYYMKADITSKEFDECRELIKLFDYSIIDAKEEADAQLVQLYKAGLVDSIASEDMDILLFGGGVLLRNFTIAHNKEIREISLSDLLKSAKITQNELIQIGILLGTDYCDIPNISPMKAYDLIKKSGDLENTTIGNKCNDARKYFQSPPVTKIKQLNDLTVTNVDHLVEFLRRFYFKNKYIDRVLENLKMTHC